MSDWGFAADDFAGDAHGPAELWPDNVEAVDLFIAMGTQWRMGPAGPIGLDYGAVPAVLRLLNHHRTHWQDSFECLRILEDEAMSAMREVRRG